MGNSTSSPAAPNYNAVLDRQSQYNKDLANQTMRINNPDQYGPNGSRTMTQGPNGAYSVNTTLSPAMQQQFDSQNRMNNAVNSQAESLLNRPGLSYGAASPMPTFDPSGAPKMNQFDLSGAGQKARYDTSGVTGMPNASESDLNAMRDSVYNQQTQYLDPQFQQNQSDLESKLANQGIMQGSEAYNRATQNLDMQKQKAYGDARNSAIQAGGAEQSRLFGLGMQARQQGVGEALNQFNTGLQNRQQGVNEALDTFNTGLQGHQQGINDALANFNTSMQARQQGVNEANSLYNAPINTLSALRGGAQVQNPTFQGVNGVSIPGIDYMGAAMQQYNSNLGSNNAENANNANYRNGLFGLGNTLIQNPGILKDAYNWMNA